MKINKSGNAESMKEMMYYLREWISQYHQKLNPEVENQFKLGSIHDSPEIITREIME
jgi:hypothetical protein